MSTVSMAFFESFKLQDLRFETHSVGLGGSLGFGLRASLLEGACKEDPAQRAKFAKPNPGFLLRNVISKLP